MTGTVRLEPGERAVCVLSGGNVEWDGLRELLEQEPVGRG